jgi:hypothetical protein
MLQTSDSSALAVQKSLKCPQDVILLLRRHTLSLYQGVALFQACLNDSLSGPRSDRRFNTLCDSLEGIGY